MVEKLFSLLQDDDARRILKQIQNLVEEETSSTRTFLTGVGPQVLRYCTTTHKKKEEKNLVKSIRVSLYSLA